MRVSKSRTWAVPRRYAAISPDMLFSGISRAPPRWATYVMRGRASTVSGAEPHSSGAGEIREAVHATVAVSAVQVTMATP
jgi:hypothetical protein